MTPISERDKRMNTHDAAWMLYDAERMENERLQAENAALKEQVAQLELVKDEHDERGIDIDILVRNLNSAEAQLTTLQSKSAALVDAMNKVSMLLCEANPNCSQEYLFGVITGTHTVSEAALAAFKGE